MRNRKVRVEVPAKKVVYRQPKLRLNHNDRQKVIYEFVPSDIAQQMVMDQMLDTWQPVAAIAARSGISVKATLSICMMLYEKSKLMMTRTRCDSHNQVHMFKKAKYITAMGIRIPVETGEEL